MKVLSTCSNENGLIFLAEFKRCGRHNIRGSGSSLTYSVETSFGEWPHMCSLFQVHFEGLVTHIRLDMIGKPHRRNLRTWTSRAFILALELSDSRALCCKLVDVKTLAPFFGS